MKAKLHDRVNSLVLNLPSTCKTLRYITQNMFHKLNRLPELMFVGMLDLQEIFLDVGNLYPVPVNEDHENLKLNCPDFRHLTKLTRLHIYTCRSLDKLPDLKSFLPEQEIELVIGNPDYGKKYKVVAGVASDEVEDYQVPKKGFDY